MRLWKCFQMRGEWGQSRAKGDGEEARETMKKISLSTCVVREAIVMGNPGVHCLQDEAASKCTWVSALPTLPPQSLLHHALAERRGSAISNLG